MGAIYRYGWRMRHIPVFGIVSELVGYDAGPEAQGVADLMEVIAELNQERHFTSWSREEPSIGR